MSWLLILVLCCGLLLAVLAVMTSQRPVVGGLAIAAMVLMTLAAFFAARPRGLSPLRPGPLAPRIPRFVVPPSPDVGQIEQRVTELARRQEEQVSKQIQDVWDRVDLVPTGERGEERHVVLTARGRASAASAEAGVHGEPTPSPRKELVRRLTRVTGLGHASGGNRTVWFTLLIGVAIAALLYMAYLFFDITTRGHFTWPLRVVSVLAFMVICVALMAIG